MAKHTYSITINRVPANRDAIEYTYRSTKCTLTCSSGAASVRYTSGVLKTFEDMISFRVDLVKDAMRKMYLLHALRFDTRLKVHKVILTIDGESMEYGKDAPGFPFLYSMLTAKSLGLPESWRDRAFQEAVLKATKSATENDLRFACLFSFLAGTGKQFEIERFTCYWTAVNSHYNYLFKCHKEAYARHLGLEKYEYVGKKQRLKEGDAPSLSALLRIYGSGESLCPQEHRRASYKSQYGAMKTLLRTIPREELPALYQALYDHRTDMTWVPEGPLGEHLKLCMDRANMSAWGFLLFEYAYYIRCNYLHGSKTTVLFASAQDPEIAAFRALNCFLGEYLKEVIPQMFREDWFTGEMYQAIARGIH